MVRAEELRVLVCVPGASIHYKCTFSLLSMQDHFYKMQYPYSSKKLDFFSVVGSILPNMRQGAAKKALKEKYTHLLFIDSDQSFPPDTLHHLLSWNKSVVGCNIATKTMPSAPSARRLGNKPVFTTPFDSGIEQVWRLGTGILLIEVAILERVPYPWFSQTWSPKRDENDGEDWFFCEQLDKAKIPIFVDHGLSYQVVHHGDFEYTHDAVPVPREVLREKGITDDQLTPDLCTIIK